MRQLDMNINITMIHNHLKVIDLHNHLLFGMDDGADTVETSLSLFNIQKEMGVNKVVVTPHYEPSNDDLESFVDKRKLHAKMLQQALKLENVDVEVKLGAEILYSVDMFDLDLEKLVIEGTDYLLIEFPTQGYISDLKRAMAQLLDQGYLPVFAHIERYGFLRSDLALMKDLVDMGVLFQVNAKTFLDASQKGFIKACIKHNLIHLVASDAHSITKRPPNLKKAYDQIEKDYGLKTVNYFKENAQCVYKNEIPDVKEPSVIRTFLGKYY